MTARKNLIIDTDLHSDVDDAGALLLGATLPNVNLLGVNVNHPGSYSALAASAILAHYGHPKIPIGIPRPMNKHRFFDEWDFKRGEYTSKVAYHWSGGTLPWGKEDEAWDPVVLYRKLLSEADDGSVTIASIGFLDNLSGLLNSKPDQYSQLDGRELAKTKVAELAVMGGKYPKGRSWNFWGSKPALAAHVLDTWDGPITFLGDTVGKHVLIGGPLMASNLKDDPIRMAYKYYGFGDPLPSWDPLVNVPPHFHREVYADFYTRMQTVFYAANGLGDMFEVAEGCGYNKINVDDGSNEWVYDGIPKRRRYLKLKASDKTAAAELDRLFLDAAQRFSKHSKSG